MMHPDECNELIMRQSNKLINYMILTMKVLNRGRIYMSNDHQLNLPPCKAHSDKILDAGETDLA